jgi:hypothetical protein
MAICPTCQTTRGPWDETCSKCGFSYKALDIEKRAAGANAADIAAGCPSCGAVRPAGETSCPGCGIMYSKWKPKERLIMAAPGGTPVLTSNDHKERPGCLTAMMVGTVLVNAGVAALCWFITISGNPSVPASAVIVAKVMIAVSVATAVCAVWVLRWKRWAVFGIAVVQILSVTSILFSGASLAYMIQPVLVLWLFHYFVSPIWHYFD